MELLHETAYTNTSIISTGREKSCVRVYNDVVHTLNDSIVPAAHNLIDELLWNEEKERDNSKGGPLFTPSVLQIPSSLFFLFNG